MQTTEAVAQRLVELCRQGRMMDAQRELMHPDCEQIEPSHALIPGVKGLAAILEKERGFDALLETIHQVDIAEPLVAGHFFTTRLRFDLTMKGQKRTVLEEIGVYEVRDGKIIRETFFY